jgi:hypothetical protein
VLTPRSTMEATYICTPTKTNTCVTNMLHLLRVPKSVKNFDTTCYLGTYECMYTKCFATQVEKLANSDFNFKSLMKISLPFKLQAERNVRKFLTLEIFATFRDQRYCAKWFVFQLHARATNLSKYS